jgi:hypothetical protein
MYGQHEAQKATTPSIINPVRFVVIKYVINHSTYTAKRSRDSVVGTATTYGLDDREVGARVPVGSRIFFSSDRPDRL